MTPALNINLLTLSITHYTRQDYYPWGAPWGGPSTSVLNRAVLYERQNRPASVTSPVRADGSRAPKGWHNQWGSSRALPRRIKFRTEIGGGFYSIYEGSTYPLGFDSGGDAIADLAGASWATPTGGAFPYNVESAARTKFLLALQNSKAQWGATLGEMRETVKGLEQWSAATIDILTVLFRAYRDAKKNPKRLLKMIKSVPVKEFSKSLADQKLPKAVVNAWLGYQFGVKPLLADIATSAEVLDLLINGDEAKAPAFVLRKGASSRNITTVRWPNTALPFWDADQDFFVEAGCHISCRYDVDITKGVSLQQLGLTNPLSVAWELLPFSWMIDYGLGVGDWIQTLTPVEGAQFVEGSLTRIMRCEDVGDIRFNPKPNTTFMSGFGPMPVRYRVGRMTREVLALSPNPALLPAWRSRMGLPQLANSLAAISQILR